MTKKELIIKTLEKLWSTRDMAPDMIALLKNTEVSDDTINNLTTIIATAIKKIKNQQIKQSLTQWLDVLHRIQKMEHNTQISDEKLDELLTQID